MDLEMVKTALMIINMLGTFAIGVWLYLEKRNDKTNARIDKVEECLEDQGTKLARIEANAANAPTHNDLGDLHERVNAVAEGMNRLTGEFSAVKATLQLIHEHLLRGGK